MVASHCNNMNDAVSSAESFFEIAHKFFVYIDF